YRLRWMAFQEISEHYGRIVRSEDHLTRKYVLDEEFFEVFHQKWKEFRPTALLVSIEADLVRVLECCERIGVRIPEDCSLISLDPTEDSRFHDIASPGIPVRETAHRAAD